MRILLVDDDESLIAVLAKRLAEHHYTVDCVADGEVGWAYGSTFDYDLIVLDIILPKLDGIALCQRLRACGCEAPILMLTVRDSRTDKIASLDAGADDYVVKPFDLEELIARIRALLRRSTANSLPVLTWEKVQLDPSSCEVIYDRQLLSLTPKEYALLELFLRHSYQVLSARAILDNLWSSEEFSAEATVRSHLRGLRRKLKAAGAPPDLIETVYGLGYRLKPPDRESEPPAAAPPSPAKNPSSKQLKHLKMLAQAWQENKQVTLDHLNALTEAAARLGEGYLSVQHREQARLSAHSLAGTLGTFGFAEGSRLALELEHLLQPDIPLSANQIPLFKALAMALRREVDGKSSAANPDKSQPLPLLLIIDEDLDNAQLLSEVAIANGLTGAISTSVSAARAWLGLDKTATQPQQRPDVVLLNFLSQNSTTSQSALCPDSLALIEELSGQEPPLPVVAIGDRSDLTARLEIARRGGATLLENSATPERIIAVAKQTLGRSHAGAKVMIVDDDRSLLGLLPNLLKPWGFKLTTLADPQQFWTVLTAVAPHLLVLDVEMPHASGLELCQLLRSDPQWNRLPILFLSAHADAKTQSQAFASGADDYVSKPIVGKDLANRILNRLERVRLLGPGLESDRLV